MIGITLQVLWQAIGGIDGDSVSSLWELIWMMMAEYWREQKWCSLGVVPVERWHREGAPENW